MRLNDLPNLCKGQDDQTIANLIRQTDEYQRVLTDGKGTLRLMRDMFNAGMLLARGSFSVDTEAMYQAAEQGMVADAAAGMAGTQLTWVPSKPYKGILEGKNDSFVKFLIDGIPFKLDDPTTSLNCWEALIVAAVNAKVIEDATRLVNLYQQKKSAWESALTAALVSGSTREYRPGSRLDTPVCGDIVLFDGLAHVAVAVEADKMSTNVVSFWPAPDMKMSEINPAGTVTTMQVTSIEAIGAWMNLNFGRAPKITFGSPSWQQLNQK